MKRSDDDEIIAGEETVERAKDALSDSLGRLGEEVERRMKGVVDHAADRAERVVHVVGESVDKVRASFDIPARVRSAPLKSIAVAAVAGFAYMMFRKRRQFALPQLAAAPARAAAEARPHFERVMHDPKAKASVVGAIASAALPIIAEVVMLAARNRLSSAGFGPRDDDGRSHLH